MRIKQADIELFLQEKTSLASTTKEHYKNIIERYMRAGNPFVVDKLQEFLYPYSPTSYNLYLTIFKQFADFIHIELPKRFNDSDYRRISRLSKRKGGRMKEPREILFEEYQDITLRLSGDLSLKGSWQLAWNFGHRPQEIVFQEIEHIDLQTRKIKIRGKYKTESAKREIDILEQQIFFLEELINERKEGRLILKDYEKNIPYSSGQELSSSFSRYIRVYHSDLIKQILCDGKYRVALSLYDGRHSFCSRNDRMGIPLGSNSILMGHSNTSTTAKYLERNKTAASKHYKEIYG
jgi:integrase